MLDQISGSPRCVARASSSTARFHDGKERRQPLGIAEAQRGRVGSERHSGQEMARQRQGPGRSVTTDLRDRQLAEGRSAHRGGVRVERKDRVGRRERVKMPVLDRPDHVGERRRRERSSPLREMARDEVQNLGVVHERVVVRLVAVGPAALAESLERPVDQTGGEPLLLEELIARRQVGGRQILRPLLRVFVVDLLAQRGEHGAVTTPCRVSRYAA